MDEWSKSLENTPKTNSVESAIDTKHFYIFINTAPWNSSLNQVYANVASLFWISGSKYLYFIIQFVRHSSLLYSLVSVINCLWMKSYEKFHCLFWHTFQTHQLTEMKWESWRKETIQFMNRRYITWHSVWLSFDSVVLFHLYISFSVARYAIGSQWLSSF